MLTIAVITGFGDYHPTVGIIGESPDIVSGGSGLEDGTVVVVEGKRKLDIPSGQRCGAFV